MTDHDDGQDHGVRVDPDVWTTTGPDGREIELPSTIAAVRAALPEEQRAAYDAELETVPGPRLTRWLVMRALETVPGLTEADEAVVARLRAGDYSGAVAVNERGEIVPADDGPGAA
ncbi:hypothetical protein [Streptomyces sp. NPDC049879]|uniref:hypothetical protein n=1 Tax=Streptomyces sp. NPDC049879 TaxID=3365598 RepID=UPI00378C318D